MEAGRGVVEADCPDVLRQILPQGGQKLRRGQIPDRAEGGNLPQGVDPGVGAPAALDLHGLAKDPAQHSLQLALDRRLHTGQPLPSPVAAAVVLKYQLVVWHNLCSAGNLPAKTLRDTAKCPNYSTIKVV